MRAILLIVLTAVWLQGADLAWLQNKKLNVKHVDGNTYVVTRFIKRECAGIGVLPDEIWKRKEVKPACIQPLVTSVGSISMMHVSEGVETFGELEVMAYIKAMGSGKTKMLIDTRSADWYDYETIPGAVNVWYKVLIKYNLFDEDFRAFLELIHAKEVGRGKFDFSQSPELLMFCNGPWCTQSPQAITALLRLGYPAEKLKWYRGGMHDWKSLSMTTTLYQP